MSTETQAAPAIPQPPDVHAEIKAMSIAYEALCDLDRDGQNRALEWLTARLSNDHYRRERARRAAGGSGYDDEAPF